MFIKFSKIIVNVNRISTVIRINEDWAHKDSTYKVRVTMANEDFVDEEYDSEKERDIRYDEFYRELTGLTL